MSAHKKNTQQLLFFSELDRFIQSLPSELSLYPSQTKTSQYYRYCNSYLNHYDLQLVDRKIAQHHYLWATKLSTAHKLYTIVQQYWQVPVVSTGKAKGTVVIVHGYLDHTGLYGNAIRWALTQGYNVLSFDLPGHGLSNGESASISHFDIYSDVLDHVISQYQKKVLIKPLEFAPLIALGQSTGCAIICNTLLKHPPPDLFQKVILLAPLVRSHRWRWLRYVYFLLRPILSRIPRQFINSSHNRTFNQFIKNADPLQASHIPLQWLGAMEQWSQTIKHEAQTCSFPLTIIQGTGDTTVDWRYNIPALNRAFPLSHTHYIPHAQHHLVNESPTYWQAIESCLTQQIQVDHSSIDRL